MKYSAFAQIINPVRMNRYLLACNGNSKKAMTLYRKNLQLTQELFTVVSCFEVALRNRIDTKCTTVFGINWLRDSTTTGGIFNNSKCVSTKTIINDAIKKLHSYSHFKLVAGLGFGFWRYMFAKNNYNATNKILLQVFPSKPISTPALQYDNKYVFNQLAKLNDIRNRMAHHEPICFLPGQPTKNTNYARQHYALILQLFQWMQVDESALLYGLDHILKICDEIDRL